MTWKLGVHAPLFCLYAAMPVPASAFLEVNSEWVGNEREIHLPTRKPAYHALMGRQGEAKVVAFQVIGFQERWWRGTKNSNLKI